MPKKNSDSHKHKPSSFERKEGMSSAHPAKHLFSNGRIKINKLLTAIGLIIVAALIAVGTVNYFTGNIFNASDLSRQETFDYAEKGLFHNKPAKISSALVPVIKETKIQEFDEDQLIGMENLILVSELDETIIIELRYASTNNFTEQVIYPVEVAVIEKETGRKLVEAHNIFKENGYRIKLWDAYRPLSAQQVLWEAYPDPAYVHKPPDPPQADNFRPRHNNGMAVDITLVDSDGNELEMPTGYDDFSLKAAPDYRDLPEDVLKNRDYMIKVMESVGFRVAPTEWWHFSYIAGNPGPYLDVPLEAFMIKE